jgi:hypothetical protein
MQLGQIDFDDLEPCGVTVTLGRGDQKQHYILREATADAAKKYQNCRARSTRFNEEGKVTGIDGVADAEPLLVSHCLCLTNPDHVTVLLDKKSNAMTVPLHTILSWKVGIVKTLFEKVREISPGLDDDTNEDALVKQIDLLTRALERVRKARADAGATASTNHAEATEAAKN